MRKPRSYVARRVTYVNRRVWYSLDSELRKAILRVLPLRKTDIVDQYMYIGTLENRLRERGEHELAEKLLKED
ncbi:MAG: hypothetical protein P1Q69_06985 [Candidatus Thorarchaeota archaeon]|nr:hypothetical protein [Candidatus Thorarchaeota archaeon]